MNVHIIHVRLIPVGARPLPPSAPPSIVMLCYRHTHTHRGTDIAKAIALGADAVGCGKAYLYGLAAGGEPGVAKAINILQDELQRAMGLLGCRTVEDLKRDGPRLIRNINELAQQQSHLIHLADRMHPTVKAQKKVKAAV